MASPHQDQPLDVRALNAALVGTRFAGHVQHFASIDSTSTALLEAAANGAPEGAVYVADEQTAGRGRGGHAWHSTPADGLYVSALVHTSLPLDRALWISLAAGLAALTALKPAIAETSGLHADIRWPNDLLLTGPGNLTRKVGGILVETAVANSRQLKYAVIGVGINVNHAAFPEDLAQLATSLRLASGQPQSRATLLLTLLRALDRELDLLETGAGDLLARFTRASTWVRGKRVQVPEAGGYTGLTAGLDSRGFLLVQTGAGEQRTVLSGGVREL